MEAEKAVSVDVRDLIMEHLKNNQRSLLWLSNQTEYVYSTMYSIFKQKVVGLTDERRAKINEVLNTNF